MGGGNSGGGNMGGGNMGGGSSGGSGIDKEVNSGKSLLPSLFLGICWLLRRDRWIDGIGLG